MAILRTAFIFSIAFASVAHGDDVEFDRQIRPLLSDVCFKCHGPDDAKRKAKLRLDTRGGLFKSIESGELSKRISSADDEERMPPPDSGVELSEEQVEVIRSWIDQGAKWKQHWSLVAPKRAKIPRVSDPSWVRNPIDAFVLARLDAEGLKPAAPAAPEVLRRRLSFDLTGLPPEPEKNTTIDEMLQSTRYAERMAFRWLDAARYADTSGYQSDGWRDMWRWRDWVIEAFDRNLPFDQFTIEQLAGDLLPKPSLEQIIATGFNRNHRGNAEGGSIPEEFQVEYVVDRVDTTFAVWQGLTFGCARCHNHKYDPFSQRDYYQVFACFNNIPEYGKALKEGNSVPWIQAPTPDQRKKLKALNRALEKQRGEYVVWQTKLPAMVAQWAKSGKIEDGWTISESLIDITNDGGRKTAKFGYFDSFSLGAWVKRTAEEQGTVISKMIPIKQEAGYYLDLTKSGTVQFNLVKRWLDDSLRVETLDAVPLNKWTHVFATYDGTRTSDAIRIYINGELIPHRANLDEINQSFVTDEPVRIGKGGSNFQGEIDDTRIYGRVLPGDEVRVVAERVPREYTRQRYFLEVAGPKKLRDVWSKLKEAKRKRDAFDRSLPTVMIMQEMAKPRETHLLVRGDYSNPAEPVNAGTPTALPPLPADAPGNRLGIAQWLVSGENPLTARVTVNRIWRDFFGVGLVKTTEDFGVQGERPSHPDLLDWLSVEFMESGWDLKRLITLIVSSNTYRQSSRVGQQLAARDPDNRLLARGPRFRLAAEMIRDQALLVSGLLTEKVGGPSVKPYQPEGLWKDFASDTDYKLASGPDLYRRSLYTYWKRTVPPPMMMNFDASSREACEVHVRRTNTPLQALNIMNDVTFIEAARVLATVSLQDKDPLHSAFNRTLGRSPKSGERQRLMESLDFFREEFQRDTKAARELVSMGESRTDTGNPVELAAWTMLCSTLLNLDEMITKE